MPSTFPFNDSRTVHELFCNFAIDSKIFLKIPLNSVLAFKDLQTASPFQLQMTSEFCKNYSIFFKEFFRIPVGKEDIT